MLVVDSIKLQAISNDPKELVLGNEYTVVIEQVFDTFHEIMRVRDMREHVGGGDHLSRAVSIKDFLCYPVGEIGLPGMNALVRYLVHLASRLDTHPDQGFWVTTQQRAIVGPDVHHHVTRAQRGGQFRGQFREMLHQNPGGPRGVRMILGEQLLLIHDVAQLHQHAIPAP